MARMPVNFCSVAVRRPTMMAMAVGMAMAVALVCLARAEGAAAGSGAPGGRSAAGRTAAAADLPAVATPDRDLLAMLLLMQERRTYESVTVLQALKGGPELRVQLAAALGRTPDRDGRSVLEGLLIDERPEVRREAAFGLGLLGDPEARPALLKAERDADRETGALAVEALGRLATPLVQVGEQLLGLPDEERWPRLLPYLFRFKEEALLPLAEHGLGLADPELHRQAAYALARDPLPAAAPLLRRLIGDGDPQVRAWAARGLGKVGTAADLDVLAPLLADAAAAPVIEALRAAVPLTAAGRGGAGAAWGPRLLELLADPRAGVRVSAIEASAAWLRGPDPALGAALATLAAAVPPAPPVGEAPAGGTAPAKTGRAPADVERGLALVALAKAGDARAPALAAAMADSIVPQLRARAAEAAGWCGPGALLVRLSGDPSPAVRETVLSARLAPGKTPAAAAAATAGAPALGGGGGGLDGGGTAGAFARAALRDADEGVRTTALEWLSDHPVAPLALLAPALTTSLGDGSIESPLGAIKALAARAAAQPRERGALVALLEQVGGQSSYVLRREASAALVGLGRPAPRLDPTLDAAAGTMPQGIDVYRQVIERTRRQQVVEVRTSRGPFRIRLDCPLAPRTCLNFLELARQHFYDGLLFHRVVPDFVVQAGDPRGDGYGGPGYTLRDEINRLRYRRGVVGMALAGADTGGSQFFVTLSPQPHLDGGYTAFGEVIAGADVLDAIEAGDRIESVAEIR